MKGIQTSTEPARTRVQIYWFHDPPPTAPSLSLALSPYLFPSHPQNPILYLQVTESFTPGAVEYIKLQDKSK